MFLHVARASGHKEFMWGCVEPYILRLFNGASPLAITLVSPYIHWSSLSSSNWVQSWETAVSLVSYTDEVGQSVVDALLQIASVDYLQPYIPTNLWLWVNKQTTLPPHLLWTFHGECLGCCPNGQSVRTDLANRPTEPMLVFDLRYMWVLGNVGTLWSGLGQTTLVCDSVTCSSGRTGIRIGDIEGPGYRGPALEEDGKLL